MVDIQESRLDAVFHALGDLTRRQMLRRLADGECTVSQLAEPFNMSLAAASKHIKVLEGTGLIHREVRGRVHLCRLNAGPLSIAEEWLRYYERFWNSRLDRLEALLRLDAAVAPTDAGARTVESTPRRGTAPPSSGAASSKPATSKRVNRTRSSTHKKRSK